MENHLFASAATSAAPAAAHALPATPADELKVRDRLLAAATRIFTEKGYAGASVGEIVAAAGVTKPILYYYFKNKEGLYLEIIQKAYGGLDRLLDEADAWTGAAAERIIRFGTRTLDLFLENLEAARVIYTVFYGPPQGAPVYDYMAHHDRYVAMLLRFVSEGIATGEFRPLDPEDVALSVSGIIEKSMDMKICNQGPQLDRERLARMLEIYFSGVRCS